MKVLIARGIGALLLLIPALLLAQTPPADVPTRVARQVADALAAKEAFTPAQQKMDSALVFTIKNQRGELGTLSFADAAPKIAADQDGMVRLEITGPSDVVAGRVVALGGEVISQFFESDWVLARIPVDQLEALAADSAVRFVEREHLVRHNVGALTTQGYVSHSVREVINNLGYTGKGVKVGVLSDSASLARVSALIASGDLGPNTTVLAGQAGEGTDEGAAMMEIVQDLAPGAQIYFATAAGGSARFAANITALGAAGCTIIVDDVYYLNEPVFQDGLIARAINAFVAGGGLYFSSAGNGGNLTNFTAATWEGDFADGGAVTTPSAGNLHSFGDLTYNAIVGTSTQYVILQWSDPSGASANDYDLFIYDSTGTTLKGMSTTIQNGSQNPFEIIQPDPLCGSATVTATGYCPAAGDRIVVERKTGAQPRALHLSVGPARLSLGTTGSTFGHGGGANTVSVAAAAWGGARSGTTAFTAANKTESFSSDGPRRIFFNPDGTPVTPANFLFASGGGNLLQKPDLTAADGVGVSTPGFFPFYGTSAAAPHAAGIAALVASARPTYSNAQIKAAMAASAIDTMAPGWDRDSGSGIVNALAAVQYALAH